MGHDLKTDLTAVVNRASGAQAVQGALCKAQDLSALLEAYFQ